MIRRLKKTVSGAADRHMAQTQIPALQPYNLPTSPGSRESALIPIRIGCPQTQKGLLKAKAPPIKEGFGVVVCINGGLPPLQDQKYGHPGM